MGLYDRDYIRTSRDAGEFSPRSWRPQSITMWLIVINIIVFLLDKGLAIAGFGVPVVYYSGDVPVSRQLFGPLEYWGHFSVMLAINHFQVWRFLTFQFLHANLGHLLFNMIALWFFGPMVEERMGPRRFLPFYLLSGMGGAVMYLILFNTGYRIGSPWVPLVGASAGIFGVLIVAAMIAPYRMVMVYGVLPVPLKTLAWVFVAIAAYTVWTSGANAGGEAAHLGGAAAGYLLWQWPEVLDFFSFGAKRPARVRGWR